MRQIRNNHKVSMILWLTTPNENLLLLRNSLARIPGTGRLLTCGDGASPRPNQLLSGTLQIRTSSPHGAFAARDQANRQNTSLDQGVASGDGAMPRPLKFFRPCISMYIFIDIRYFSAMLSPSFVGGRPCPTISA